uniref:ATP-dependent DNA helicase n=1 Tax=Phallusia mammillata TaxID=59560 RepID=A0A6F9DR91_9ASCI|nr:ATP-dependent DNA helicase Q1-like [Phallusia mammillata]
MWHRALKLPQRRFRVPAKMLQAQNHKGLYQAVGNMPQLWDDVRSSLDNPTASRAENSRRQSLLEVEHKRNWKKTKPISRVHGLHVKQQDISNRISEKERELEQLKYAQKLVQLQISESNGRNPTLQNMTPWMTPQSQMCVDQWKVENFNWSPQVRSKLEELFHLKNFWPKQLEAINATMSNQDVLLITSTGGGKSLCYQLPALLSTGVTVVISPLVSLIEDQVLSLRKRGIAARMLTSRTSPDEALCIYDDLQSNHPEIKLLYLTPEKISKSKKLMSQLDKCYKAHNLSRFAIDEVHCVSQWGNDFRPDYKYLGILKRQFRDVPIIGLTATATNKVTEDTKNILNISDAVVLRAPLFRSNLFYEVRAKPDTHQKVVKDISDTVKLSFNGESGLVYCLSRRNCTDVCKGLQSHGLSAAVYHAGLTSEEKTETHQKWINNEIKILCSTVAFGMGIDKPDVRFVIHHSMSKSIECYFQESGRAGRDGHPALCLLYFGYSDVFRLSSMVFTQTFGPENLEKMLEYCQSSNACRHRFIGRHFGDESDTCKCTGMCDVCSGFRAKISHDITEACRALLAIVKASRGNDLTGRQLIIKARQGGTENPELKRYTKEKLQSIVLYMLQKQYLSKLYCFTSYDKVLYLVPGPKSHDLKAGKVQMDFYVAKRPRETIYKKRFCNKLTPIVKTST